MNYLFSLNISHTKAIHTKFIQYLGFIDRKIIHYAYTIWDILILKQSCNIWDTLVLKIFMVYLKFKFKWASIFI